LPRRTRTAPTTSAGNDEGLSTARRSMASWWSSTLVTLPLLLPTPNESQTSQDVFDRSFAAGCSTRRRARPR
jgi:hypothetical protein